MLKSDPSSEVMDLRKVSPIDPQQLGANENAKSIERINIALVNYQSAEKNQKKFLDELIQACDEYIKQIPKERRNRDNENEAWSILLPEWPHIEKILALQKQAVYLGVLGQEESNARARWDLLRNFYNFDQTNKTKVKRLEEKYWGEFRFQGQMAIANWVSGGTYDNSFNLRSVSEVIERDILAKGINKQQITYFDEKELKFHQLSFKKGKAWFREKKFDTTSAMGVHIDHGECIFVADRTGNIYVSDPDIRLGPDIHHSSFLRGKPVLAAGTMRVQNGEIVEITILSGHYKPTREELLNFLKLLKETYNVDLTKVSVIDNVDRTKRNADKYLKTKGFCLPEPEKGFASQLQRNFEFAVGEQQTLDAKLGELNSELFFRQYNRKLPRDQLKTFYLTEIKKIIQPMHKISDLHELFTLLKGGGGKDAREEKGFFKIFGSEGKTKRWQETILEIQKKAYLLAANDKIGITPSEYRQLVEIMNEPVARLKLFQSPYKEAFERLKRDGTLKVLDLESIAAKHSK